MTADLGSTCYNIIDELANQVSGYRTVSEGKIIVSPLIGQDKTQTMQFFFD
jgi:hypothetical protein